jgi:hypothetical protein
LKSARTDLSKFRLVKLKYSKEKQIENIEKREITVNEGASIPCFSKNQTFAMLESVLIKFFVKKEINYDEFNLNKNENKIFESIIKKKSKTKTISCLSVKLINKVMRTSQPKRKEYYLKFILLKCFSYLKEQFFKKNISTCNPLKLNYRGQSKMEQTAFYSHYFGEISEEEGIPLENFFVFKNWTHRFSKNIPKSITGHSLELWKKNPMFVNKIIEFLDGDFIKFFYEFNKEKITKMVQKWRQYVITFGKEKATQFIVESINKKGAKIPWTLQEVLDGIKYTKEALTN